MSRPTIQQVLAFEADFVGAPTAKQTEIRRRFGLSLAGYLQLILGIRNDPDQLRRALELDPVTTNRILDRLDRDHQRREQATGRTPR